MNAKEFRDAVAEERDLAQTLLTCEPASLPFYAARYAEARRKVEALVEEELCATSTPET